MLGQTPRSTLFPYTTLFRSDPNHVRALGAGGFVLPLHGGFGHDQSADRSEEHTSELQSLQHLVCRLLFECSGKHRDLHSFPTRRSSDLILIMFGLWALGVSFYLYMAVSGMTNPPIDRKSTRLNSSHFSISYAVFCLNARANTEIYTLSLHDALPI